MSELLASLNINPEKDLQERPEKSAWENLSQSFVYEGQQQLKGLAQAVGKGDLVSSGEAPAEAQSTIGQHAQMFGRAAADVIPIIVTGIAVRAGFGKIIPKAAEPSLMLQRSAIGLNGVETATTGFLTGSLLRPTDDQDASTLTSFLEDRTRGGVSGALSFLAFNGLNHGATKIVGGKSFVGAVLSNPIGNGLITGAPAGFLNAQIDSVVRTGTINTDRTQIGTSMYEMTMIGGAFGAVSAMGNRGARIAPSTEVAVGTQKFHFENLALPEDFGKTETAAKPELTNLKIMEPTPQSEPTNVKVTEPTLNAELANAKVTETAPQPAVIHDKVIMPVDHSGSMSGDMHDLPMFAPHDARKVAEIYKNWSEKHIGKGTGVNFFGKVTQSKADKPKGPSKIAKLLGDGGEETGDTASPAGTPDVVESVKAPAAKEDGSAFVVEEKFGTLAEIGNKIPETHHPNFGTAKDVLAINEWTKLNKEPVELDIDQVLSHEAQQNLPGTIPGISPLSHPKFSPGVVEIGAHLDSSGKAAVVNDEGSSAKKVKSIHSYFEAIAKSTMGNSDFFGNIFGGKNMASVREDAKIALTTLEGHYGAESPELNALRKSEYLFHAKDIANFVDENPTRRAQAISEQVLAGQIPDVQLMRAFEVMGDRFGDTSQTYQFFKDNKETHKDLGNLGKFIEEKPEERAKLVADLVQTDPHVSELNADLLSSMEVLREHLGADSAAMKLIDKHHSDWATGLRNGEGEKKEVKPDPKPSEFGGAHYHDMWNTSYSKQSLIEGLQAAADFVKEEPEAHAGIVARAIQSGANPTELTEDHLGYLKTIETVFGQDSPTAAKIRSLQSHELVFEIGNTVEEHPESNKLITRLLNEGATDPQAFDTERIGALDTLEKTYGQNSQVLSRLLELERTGLSLDEVGDFISGSDLHSALIRRSRMDSGAIVFIDEVDPIKPSGLLSTAQKELHEELGGTFSNAYYDPIKGIVVAPDMHVPPLSVENMEFEGTKVAPRLDPTASIESAAGTAEVVHANSEVPATPGVKWVGKIPTTKSYSELPAAGLETKSATPKVEANSEVPAGMEPISSSEIPAHAIEIEEHLPEAKPEGLENDASKQKRIALVERLVNEGAATEQLQRGRLDALVELEDKLGAGSKLLQKILHAEQSTKVELSNFSRLLSEDLSRNRRIVFEDSSPAGSVRPEFLEKVLDLIRPQNTLSKTKLYDLQSFDDATHGALDLKTLFDRQNQGLELGNLSKFIAEKNPTEPGESAAVNPRMAKVTQLIHDGADADALNPKRLRALESLSDAFGTESPLLQQILQVSGKTSNVRKLADFVSKDPEPRVDLIRRVMAGDSVAARMDPTRLEGVAKLEKAFNHESDYMKKLLAAEANGLSLTEVATFLEPQSAKNLLISSLGKTEAPAPSAEPVAPSKEHVSDKQLLLQQLLDENVGPDKLTFNYLNSRYKLNEYLGADSSTMKRVLELDNQGLNIQKLREFIDEDPSDHKLMVQRFVDSGASIAELSYSRLRGLSILINKLNPEKGSFDHILSLEKQGLVLSELARYVSEDSNARVPQINSLLENRASIKELNVKRLADAAVLTKIQKYFNDDPDAVKYISDLQVEGLSANRLMRFIEEEPVGRKALVKRLISERAGEDRFNKQMTLSLFPDDVAYAILDTAQKEGSSLAHVLGALKKWDTGAKFHQAVIDYVKAGNVPSIDVLEQLNNKIREGKVEIELRPPEAQSARARTSRGAEVADIVKQALASIERDIPKEKPIVLLGRDNWLLYPSLHAQGRPVQYFLWSRLQGADAKTGNQWLKEVPPNAAVIDTGYSGTIIDWIRRIDPTASGYLLSSRGRYPQLLSGYHSSMVQKIEYFPKLVGRSKTYTENGGAVSKNSSRDYDEEKGVRDLNHRWFVQGANTDMLRALGLPEWNIWRFGDYVGLTPEERLGLNTRAQVQQHYLRVEQARQQASEQSSARH